MGHLIPGTPRPLLPLLVIFCTCCVLTWLLCLSTVASTADLLCPANAKVLPAEVGGTAANRTVMTAAAEKRQKPVLLVWWWPLGVRFSSEDCATHFDVNGCIVTDDRSSYGSADAVVFFHKYVAENGGNLPTESRPPFQKWIWYNVESPTNTAKKVPTDGAFNLTLSWRRDSDVVFRYELSIIRSPGRFELPLKDKLVCWISTNSISGTGATTRLKYYNELRKHVKVNIYGRAVPGAVPLSNDEYYLTIGNCKFYLAFENSVHDDYITEKLNGPLVAGTIPVVLGASRENYEQFVPADSFIHVDDFTDPKALAEHILELDRNLDKYMRYFEWRRHFKATPHLLVKRHIQPICLACEHIAKDNGYQVVHDLSWWFNGNVEGHQW